MLTTSHMSIPADRMVSWTTSGTRAGSRSWRIRRIAQPATNLL